MNEVFVLIGQYGDIDSTCFGVFSSESSCENQLLRLRKRFDGSLWRFTYRSFVLDNIDLIDHYITSFNLPSWSLMEVRVYLNSSAFSANKPSLVKRVESCSDILFPFDSTIRAFKAIYGDNCIIEFLVL